MVCDVTKVIRAFCLVTDFIFSVNIVFICDCDCDHQAEDQDFKPTSLWKFKTGTAYLAYF